MSSIEICESAVESRSSLVAVDTIRTTTCRRGREFEGESRVHVDLFKPRTGRVHPNRHGLCAT